MKLFEPAQIGNLQLKNRLIRAATFESACDSDGAPQQAYFDLYEKLAQSGAGALITGFSFISQEGRAMHIGQAGLEKKENSALFAKLTARVHQYDAVIFFQLAHAGRQTRSVDTGMEVVGVSAKRSLYYLEKPRVLHTEEVYQRAEAFAEAAANAKAAGFDGIQLHAAHGYLIHQFLLPAINNRRDEFGIDPHTQLGTRFLDLVLAKIEQACGPDFPVLLKISCTDNYHHPFSRQQYINLIHHLDTTNVAAIEISCGTMDYSLNIFRGDLPMNVIYKVNPIYKTNSKMVQRLLESTLVPYLKHKTKPFTYNYNLEYARLAKQYTAIPIICVGGFRKGTDIEQALANHDTDLVSMSRPFLADSNLVEALKQDITYVSPCTNCNICTVMCDSGKPVRCYRQPK